jgi:predicted TIM-barrel fold metal-dependent hydrolase
MTKLTIAAATVLVAAVLHAPAASSRSQPDPITATQKRDIFYNNAARFLRLPAVAQ